MLDKAIEALRSYDWGKDYKAIKPIEDAIVDSHGDAEARKALENQLVDVLKSDASQAAKDFVCRRLRIIGTPASVPAIAALLTDEKLSHMARYALQCMPAAEAGKALLDALPKTEGALQVGIISSIGVRQDNAAVDALGKLVNGSDAHVARAAASALGAIQTPEASKALGGSNAKDAAVVDAVTDAELSCAEALLAAGNKPAAMVVYKKYANSEKKHVKVAAKRGLLSSLGGK